MIYTLINIGILLILALLHIYWAMGGTKGIASAIPITAEGKPSFEVGTLGALAVAVALISFAYLHYAFYHSVDGVKEVAGYLLLVGSLVFFIRAIGDFKYCGLFKKVRNTKFARNDTWLYTPLCIIISALAIVTYLTFKI